MNILFNCTTNVVGGGLKNSAFFIRYTLKNQTLNWHFAICKPVYNLLIEWELELPNDRFTIFKTSPSKDIKARKKLIALTKELKIDLAYTMAGPAYVKFPCQHLQGISNGYITHADWEAFRFQGNILKTLKYYAYVGIQFLYSLRASDFVFQTQYAKDSFKKRSKLQEHRLHVISNAFDLSLRDYFYHLSNNVQVKSNSEIIIFCPGAGYLHKGFQYIPQIVKELRNLTDVKFKFILTLPFDSKIWLRIKLETKKLNLANDIVNNGSFKYSELKNMLETCHIVFVPSLLETFSASYLEAMCAKKKLVVANKNFAREICEDYATYITPQNQKNTALAFLKIFQNPNASNEEKKLADKILNKYGDQEHRYNVILTLIHKVASK